MGAESRNRSSSKGVKKPAAKKRPARKASGKPDSAPARARGGKGEPSAKPTMRSALDKASPGKKTAKQAAASRTPRTREPAEPEAGVARKGAPAGRKAVAPVKLEPSAGETPVRARTGSSTQASASKPEAPAPSRPLITLTVATRQSPLATAQTELAIAYLKGKLPGYEFRILPIVTTGDRQAEWSLEAEGGKGLFIREIEAALLEGRADIAIHSAKDLPTDETRGLQIAGFLPREDPRDVLIIRKDLPRPNSIATGSPRRRQQLARQFTKAGFCEIRGNVETRLRKVSEGLADSTVLAAAGLKRLEITEYPGFRFQILPLAVSVPAAGQGAIAVQTRQDAAAILAPVLDPVTRRAVALERAFLRRMQGGCNTAFAVHYDGIGVHLFHDACGYQRFSVTPQDALEPDRVAARVLSGLEINA